MFDRGSRKMSSEEEDYMSDAFLNQCQNIRPGLAPKNSYRKQESPRADGHTRKNVNPSISKKKLELHNRETGLNTEISTSSKGFLLLQKMGYKPGAGIGKFGEGRREPINIEVKSGREGLGVESERKRKSYEMNQRRASAAAKRRKYSENQAQSFLARMKDKFAEKNVERDLRTAQKTCLQLDQQQGVVMPGHPFFWPIASLPKMVDDENDRLNEDDEDNPETSSYSISKIDIAGRCDSDSDVDDTGDPPIPSDLEAADQLKILTSYLRNTYCYCIWCGTAYDDESDLISQCPGNSSDSHD